MAMPYASLSPAGGADHRSSTATASLLPFCRSTPLSAASGGGLAEDAQQMSGRWAAVARPLPFTPAQYEELEQQALIYKYLVAGVSVPPDLVVPIRRGLDSLATRFYGHPTLAYGSYYGKKLDPEPGRCRRTDGKKWRCSKEAAPDSKYCERHMHRGRNRSRKPVEAQLVPQSQPPATAPVVSAAAPLAAATNGSSFQNHSLYPAIAASTGGGGGASASNISSTFSSPLGSSQLHMDSAASCAALGGGAAKDLRYNAYGIRTLADEHNQLIAEAINSSMENHWRLPPSQNSSFPLSSYPQLGALSDLGQNTVSSLSKMDRQPLSFLGTDFGGVDSVKQENQTLRPFFDEWPKARESWPGLSDGNNNLASFPATQLSISMASSDFSVASSQSPNGNKLCCAGEINGSSTVSSMLQL
ncbi:hypothetical protein HU200_012463 [Digitaria exilis]|uniref:Growth-regulating factor n=1 Tax=Digitaria exilis TaxID=1010633 RepID=A0A835KKH5_9POAL|nr:hypothetical protein HU200_012463 [Digitaria exilis]